MQVWTFERTNHAMAQARSAGQQICSHGNRGRRPIRNGSMTWAGQEDEQAHANSQSHSCRPTLQAMHRILVLFHALWVRDICLPARARTRAIRIQLAWHGTRHNCFHLYLLVSMLIALFSHLVIWVLLGKGNDNATFWLLKIRALSLYSVL